MSLFRVECNSMNSFFFHHFCFTFSFFCCKSLTISSTERLPQKQRVCLCVFCSAPLVSPLFCLTGNAIYCCAHPCDCYRSLCQIVYGSLWGKWGFFLPCYVHSAVCIHSQTNRFPLRVEKTFCKTQMNDLFIAALLCPLFNVTAGDHLMFDLLLWH